MSRTIGAVAAAIALLAMPALADVQGASVTFDALSDAAYVDVGTSNSVGFRLVAGTLAATLTPEVSPDGGQTWVATGFITPATNAFASTLVLTNPSAATYREVRILGGTTRVRVRVSSYTSGTAEAALRSTNAPATVSIEGVASGVAVPISGSVTATPSAVGAGTAAAAGRVTLASDDPAVTALQIMDDWDESNRAAVNVISGQVGIAGGTGVDGATVPRVTLATNVGLPAGTSNIGDVDIDSMPAAGTLDTEQTGQTGDFLVEAATANLRLLCWTAREDAGTAAVATVILRHGGDATCNETGVFAYIELAANQSAGDCFGDRGVAAASGICADVVAGSVSVNVITVAEAAP